MVNTNKAMDQLLGHFQNRIIEQPNQLQDLFKEGFLHEDNCAFFAHLKKQNPHLKLDQFDDHTAYECTINSLHISDYVCSTSDGTMLQHGLHFSECLIEKWNQENGDVKITIIVSVNSYEDEDEDEDEVKLTTEDLSTDCAVTFHIQRGDVSYLAKNLESFIHPVLTISSSPNSLEWLSRNQS